MDKLWQDIRYGVRMMLKHRVATLVAVLTLALGIGATTSIFTITSELLLRPRPGIGAPGELVDLGQSFNDQRFDTLSYPNYQDFRDRNRSFSGVLAYTVEPRPASLNSDGSAQRLYSALVSGNYFSVLQVKPALGRFFTQEEDRVGNPRPVTVLSYAFWQKRLHGDPGILGRELTVNRNSFVVVGVAPPDFRGTSILAPEAWFPLASTPFIIPGSKLLESRASCWLIALGRLKPGVDLQQARAEADSLGGQLRREFPDDNAGRAWVLYSSRLFPGEIQQYVAGFMALLMVIVGLILLIVCINVAGILLVRATSRRREVAIRLALGAGKARIVRQLLTEGVLLFLAGGGLGLLVAAWMCDLMMRLIPTLPVPVSLQLHLDWRVMGFALAVSCITGVLSALAPALQVARPELVGALKDESQGGARRLRLRHALVLGQVALSLLLLVCGGLFLRALSRARTLDPGFSADNVQTVEFDFSLAGYASQDGQQAADRLVERVRALPGVQSAALAWTLPLDNNGRSLGGILVPGRPSEPGREMLYTDWNVITPGYFASMRIPILRGRDITAEDREGAQGVVIINETLAGQLWPGEDPVGRQLRAGEPARDGSMDALRTLTVIGVARNHKYRSLGDDARTFIYVPFSQYYVSKMNLLVRTQPGVAVYPAVRAVVREINPALPILHAQSLKDYTAIGLLPQRVAGWLSGTLGALGLLLTGIGIYGVTAFSVGQRTREIGIRIALGASRRDILRLILRAGARLALAGMATGLLLALVATHLIGSLLVGVSAQDPVTFGGVTLLMGLVVLIASFIPAWRAAKADPMAALRFE